jgi:hypothetical protein
MPANKADSVLNAKSRIDTNTSYGILMPIGEEFRHRSGPRGTQRYSVVCECECGRVVIILVSKLLCYQKRCKHRCEGLMSQYISERNAWYNARDRCTNIMHPGYEEYGGRGISMVEEWACSFATFLKHIGPKPSPELTLERINNDGDYAPGNVKWGTRSEQSSNRRPFTRAY